MVSPLDSEMLYKTDEKNAVHRRDAEFAENPLILFSDERPENKKAQHGSLYISALSAEIYNLHSLRPLRLCGENILRVPALADKRVH
jgi:hypothetical protein